MTDFTDICAKSTCLLKYPVQLKTFYISFSTCFWQEKKKKDKYSYSDLT